MAFESTELLISVSTLVILGALFFFLKKASDKNPDMQVGELITYVLIKRSWDGFMISIILLGIFEALTAASIQPAGEVEINPFIRMCGHAVITFIYTVAGVNLPVQIYRLILAIMNKGGFAKIMGKFTLVLGYAIVALAMPLLNLFTVASGCKQHEELMMLFMEWFNTDQFCREYYLAVGLAADFSPWKALPQILQVNTMITILVHPLLIFLDGVHTFASGSASTLDILAEKAKTKDLDGKEKKDIKNKAKKDLEDVKDPLKEKETKADVSASVRMVGEILEFYGGVFTNKEKRDSRAEALVNRTFKKYVEAEDNGKQEKFLELVSNLIVDIKTAKSKNYDDAKKLEIKKRIMSKFKESPANGGFGEDLPSPK